MKEWFRADQPTMLSDYLQSIGYNRIVKGSQVFEFKQELRKNGKTIIDKSTVTIHKDCPAIEAAKAIIRGDVIIQGTVHYERLTQGWRCKNNRQDNHARMLLKKTSFEDGLVTTKHKLSIFHDIPK